jgi:hypothetical protein
MAPRTLGVISIHPNMLHEQSHLSPISLSRALPYAAVGPRRANRAARRAFETADRDIPACVRCGGHISCVGLRRTR